MGRLFVYIPNYIIVQHQYSQVPDVASFDMHVHDHYELYYFISGKGEFYVEGTKYMLSPGCILLMQPGESHQLFISEDEPYERITVHFHKRVIDYITTHKEIFTILNERPIGVGTFYPEDQLNQDMIRSCFSEMKRQLESGLYEEQYKRRMIVLSYLLPVLLDLQNYYIKEGKNVRVSDDGPINAVIAYINEHLADDISVEQLSKDFYISKSTLNQKFKKATGTSVWDFILTKRLVTAHIKIMDGQPIRTAFLESGFHDYSAFYRRYLHKFGVSPAKSRMNAE